MKTDTQNDKTGRRALLAGSGAMLAGFGLLAGTGAPELARVSPDAELITLCEMFNDLQRQVLSSFEKIEDDEERTARNDPIQQIQSDLFNKIILMQASTLEGVQARAQMIALWSPDFFEGKLCSDWIDSMLHSLIVDLVELPNSSQTQSLDFAF